MSVLSGTLSFNQTIATDQLIATITPTNVVRVKSICVDGSNITTVFTVKIFEKIDGTNSRELNNLDLVAGALGQSLYHAGGWFDKEIKIYVSGTGLGLGTVNVPYRILYSDIIDEDFSNTQKASITVAVPTVAQINTGTDATITANTLMKKISNTQGVS
jgi:hypothetical protein